MEKNGIFTGPIFIVGMPRSGTKLIRDILNNHSLISIMTNESKCIPYFYSKRHRYGHFENPDDFHKFYIDFSRTVFFERITKDNIFINEASWRKAILNWSFAGIIEAFYKEHARSKGKIIWGDKTPSYLLSMPLLKQVFPDARFIHIIRDPRDFCLSMKNAWNKNIYRAAQRWTDSINKCRSDAKTIQESHYIEIYYESLIDQPDDVVNKISNFLQIPYEKEMLDLKNITENLGDAKNSVGILRGNYGKWKKYIPQKKVSIIESICSPLMHEMGYPTESVSEPIRLNRFKMALFKLIDGINILLFTIKESSISNVFLICYRLILGPK